MNYETHDTERAALYALGALNESEVHEFERHARTCPQCARAIGDAERDVALLVALQPQHQPPLELTARVQRALRPPTPLPYHPWRFGTVAAALLIGLLPSAWLWQENRSMHAVMTEQSAAMDRLASVPHRTAPFTGMPQGMQATVAYAPSGAWYVILVRGLSKRLSVAWMHDGAKTMLGDAVPHGGTAMLYLPKSHRMDQLALMDGERVVALAQLR